MPYQTWTHTCTKTGKSSTRFAPFRCWSCWRPAEYDGWRRGVHEGMYSGASQGLKPIGPHWAFANRVFSNVFTPCPNCEGKGVLDGDAPGTYAYCGPCTGGDWLPPFPTTRLRGAAPWSSSGSRRLPATTSAYPSERRWNARARSAARAARR